MSHENGWKAINLEFADKVPRTEYSTASNWPLLKKVTGIDTTIEENRPEAQKKFYDIWDYSLQWSILVGGGFLKENGGRTTSMGHAVYQNDGADFNDDVFQAFETPEDVLKIDPCEEYGQFDQQDLIRRFEDHYQRNHQNSPNTVTMSGIYITMFSGLIDILGFDMLLMTMGLYEKEFSKFIDGYYHWIKQFFDAYAKTDIPVMMVHDDLCWTEGPVTHPEWYRQYIFPHIKNLIKPVKEAGKKILFTSDGTIDEFYDDIVDAGADMVFMEPTCDIRKFAEKHGERCGFCGGMDCRDIIYGDFASIEKKMKDLMEFGKRYPGFVLAVGNHLPPDTPVDKALFYNEMYEKYAYRS